MKKIKGTVTFFIVFLIILTLYMLLYKNIDIFLPIHQNELYSFSNELQKEQKEFLIEMYEQIQMQNNYKNIDSEEFKRISKNNLVYNIIRNNTYKEIIDEDLELLALDYLYTEELYNTIYGNLKVVRGFNLGYSNLEFAVIYSDDMKKICYLNISELLYIIESQYFDESYEIQSIFEEKSKEELNQDEKRSKDDIINNCKERFLEFIKEYDFEPDTIIYKGNYYILKDTKQDITIYYDSNNNSIFGLYIGFGK